MEVRHHVGITNAQEANPDPWIAEQTREVNRLLNENLFNEAVDCASEITRRSVGELKSLFQSHGVTVEKLDCDCFGIFEGTVEPSYGIVVTGRTSDVVAAAEEFGRRHAQQAVLVASETGAAEAGPNSRASMAVCLNQPVSLKEAVRITVLLERSFGLRGETFNVSESVLAIYHTENLGMTSSEFDSACFKAASELRHAYKSLKTVMGKYEIRFRELTP